MTLTDREVELLRECVPTIRAVLGGDDSPFEKPGQNEVDIDRDELDLIVLLNRIERIS